MINNFKEYIKTRLILLKASIVYTFQIETAYWFNNWGNIISTTAFIITEILFIEIIYSNVKTIAGYSRDEMLFFTLISQFWYYTIVGLFNTNIDKLNRDVNSGFLDLVLVKPIPALFYVNFRNLKLFSLLRDGLPPMIILGAAINWSQINISPLTFIFGLVIFLCGILCSMSIQLISALPSFWIGEASSLGMTILELEYNTGHLFPLEGWKEPLKTIFLTILPFGISTGATVSVMLGKFEPLPIVIVSIIIGFVFLQLRSLAWNFALRHYSSASS